MSEHRLDEGRPPDLDARQADLDARRADLLALRRLAGELDRIPADAPERLELEREQLALIERINAWIHE